MQESCLGGIMVTKSLLWLTELSSLITTHGTTVTSLKSERFVYFSWKFLILFFKAFASSEDKAIEIMRQLDVDYVLIIFGGMTGYASDDINKFLWMVRIAGSTDPNVKEADYFTKQGN